MTGPLYFLAIIPPEEICDKVTAIKKEFAENYRSSKALRIIPHITLIPPFHMNEDRESEVFKTLHEFCTPLHPFEIILNGFGCFKNRNKVVFIDVEGNQNLNTIQSELFSAITALQIILPEPPDDYHHHMTVAYRDLNEDAFHSAWPLFEKRKFSERFIAEGIYFLKHDTQKWEPMHFEKFHG